MLPRMALWQQERINWKVKEECEIFINKFKALFPLPQTKKINNQMTQGNHLSAHLISRSSVSTQCYGDFGKSIVLKVLHGESDTQLT